MSDPRVLVAVSILRYRNMVCVGTRGKGERQGLLNLPGGFVEEHTDQKAVSAFSQNRRRPLGFTNQVDGETIFEAAIRELIEETGYCGPDLRVRIICDRLATTRHERLVFVELCPVVSFWDRVRMWFSGPPHSWFDVKNVKTPGELNDIRWISLANLPSTEEWSFPIFPAVLSEISAGKF
jgi:8-oxo-dGTP pyrophosphatase MutT (NUDIX family)